MSKAFTFLSVEHAKYIQLVFIYKTITSKNQTYVKKTNNAYTIFSILEQYFESILSLRRTLLCLNLKKLNQKLCLYLL